MAASPIEIRKARAWLQSRGIGTRMISPEKFASSAKEMDKPFREVLELLARLELGGQGQQRERQDIVRKAAEAEES